ncbi:MAG: sugar phosphate isomerase/epimerase and 4-hydroxyphenylpyruvate domain-containing protein [Alphaproteobacteria bacterium]|nr:sugar phosphate isomerase/epimerase and 4-hydroxyphenylpyruvate domain-containing protein [Alphaproteobacteria bacterium]
MRRSIATVSLSGTLEEKLEAAAVARFDAVEIFENDLLFFDGSPRDVRRMAADLGLEIPLYQPFRDFEGVTDDQLRRNLDRAERKFDVMQELGAPLVLVCSNVSPATIDDDARAADQLAMLAERAARRGLRVGYEALAWGARVNRYAHSWRLVERAGHPHLGIILDSFHILARGDDPAAIRDIPGDRIFFVQIADAPLMNLDLLSWSRHYRCLPGQGDLDLAGMTAAVVEAGYTGPLSLEIFNDEFRASPTRATAQDGMRALAFLEEQVRIRLGGRHPGLFDPPPAPALSGLAFVEFAVEGADERKLGQWFEALGFRRAGRHRSKQVTLFAQGDINLVLNAEPGSFAQSYYRVHGPAICALGLATTDERAALARATAFGATRFEGRIGPNERAIPAVRSLDGSLLYFVGATAGGSALDQDFLRDDNDESGASRPTLGLDRIDHLAQALPAGQLDSWVLFYRAVLGLTPEARWELADPYGIVHSRVVRAPDGSLRIPLNISDKRNTATARSVSTFAGAGVHHIAFSTPDIFAAAAALRAGSLPLLDIPANYYDDLIARYALDGDLVARMARLGILYDRQGDGEFFHLYTQPFEDRFFFELVQRVGGYDQYGAVNAPARMAALARLRARQRPPADLM